MTHLTGLAMWIEQQLVLQTEGFHRNVIEKFASSKGRMDFYFGIFHSYICKNCFCCLEWCTYLKTQNPPLDVCIYVLNLQLYNPVAVTQ